MAKRFQIPPVPTGEVAKYTTDPYNLSSIYMFGSSSPFTGQGNTIVRPDDDLIIQKGGNRALIIYKRLLWDSSVQASFMKLCQEITSRDWLLTPASEKPGDLAVKDYVEEALSSLDIDDLYKGLGEALICGFSVGEVMWKKSKQGIIPFDVRIRDQRRFVFQESEQADTGFTMRVLTFNRMFEGIELPARKFIIQRYWLSHTGDPYGTGLGRILYPIVKFRRRAIESYVLYGDRYATPTAIAKAPLSASNVEIDTLYDHLSNLSQETAMILPEGYELEFLNPSGSADIFMNLIEYIDKEISLLICGEDEAGQAEAGSRASAQVANMVRVIRASELSQLISQTLSDTLIRWIVDLNFGVNVEAPTISREFRIEESQLTMADVSLLIQSGYKPKKEWLENHFKVDLAEEEDFQAAAPQSEIEGEPESYDPETDGDLYDKIFGDDSKKPFGDEEITEDEATSMSNDDDEEKAVAESS